MAKDYYGTLGVAKSASKEEIKKAFHKLAHQYHPDKKGGDEKRFKEINEAYQVLSDDKKRSQYDQFGEAGINQGPAGFGGGFEGFNAGGFGGFDGVDLGDIFGDLFGGGGRNRVARGRDIETSLHLTFEESVFGVKSELSISRIASCEHCEGSGAEPGSEIVTCTTCQGKGKISRTQRTILGAFATSVPCDSCGGSGRIPKTSCKTCDGKGVVKKKDTIFVSVPAGVRDGEVLRMSGKGEAVKNGVPGDLYIRLTVRAHATFRWEGETLATDLKIKLTDSLLGATHTIKGLGGEMIEVKIPEGIKHKDILRLKERGAPNVKGKKSDIFIHVHVEIPQKISSRARDILQELRKLGY